MVNKTFYAELLNNPDWITLRNKILKRDKYKCTVCGSHDNLQVHHTYYYKKEVAPWCYPSESLLTLCDKCHRDYHMFNEITIKDNPKKTFHKHKKKQKDRKPHEPSIKSKDQAKHSIHPPLYRKRINGKWFKFEVKY